MMLYQRGEYAAFTELYERHAGKVYAYLRGHLTQKGDADDLLQVVFLKLHEHRQRYNPSFPFLPWLFSITRNSVVDSSRKKKAVLVEEATLERVAGAQPVEPEGNAVELQAALASLPAGQRELIQMRFEQGLSFEEIAKRLKLKAPSVRKRVSRTLEGLRKVFGKKYE